MKFSADLYKQAMDKIAKPQVGSSAYEIDQRYKDKILKNEIIDTFAGWDGSSKTYDKEMVIREYTRKKLWYIPFVVLGLSGLILMLFITFKNIDIRLNGEKIYANYEENSRFCAHIDKKSGQRKYNGYVFLAKKNTEDIKTYIEFSLGISKYISYSVSYDSSIEGDFNNKISSSTVTELHNLGYEPIEMAVMVDYDIPFFYECDRNKGVALYYYPQNGETVFDLKVIEKLWIIILLDIILLIYNGFLLWRIIVNVRETKRINRSFNTNN